MGKVPRRVLTALSIMASVGSAVACGAPTQTAEPDCTSQLRFHGATYTAYRLTPEHSKKIGLATPWCSGRALDGGRRATVWSFPGESPTEVIGRQGVRGQFAVYVVDSLSPDERSRILRSITAGDRTPETTPAAGTGPDKGDWSRHRAVKYADDRLDLDINESDPGAVASNPDARTAVSRDAAVATARTSANPDGGLAAAVELVVTSPSFGRREENSASGTVVPAMDHTLVWVVVFHVTVPGYSDIQMANDPSLEENPMVDTVDSVIIDATTGKPFFASLG